MARSGAPQGMWWLAKSIASATWTVAATVQDSLERSPNSPFLVAAVVVVSSTRPFLLPNWCPALLPIPLMSSISIKGIASFLPNQHDSL